MIVGYLLLFTVSYLTADTAAYFNGQQQTSEILITAGTWDDEEVEEPATEETDEESEAEDEEEKDHNGLAFTDEESQHLDTCPATIEVDITNEGDDMEADGFYEVYYTEAGDPQEDGEQIELNEDDEEGIIEALANDETVTLTFEANDPGVYAFVVYKHEDAVEEDGVWSEDITVECDVDEASNEDETEENETSSTEEASTDKENADNEETDEETEEAQETESDNQENKKQSLTNDDDSPNAEDVKNEETEDHEMD